MHENVAVEIDTAALQKLLKADHVGPVSRVQQGVAEHLAGRFDSDCLDEVPRQVPPGAFGLKLVVQECPIRPDALYSAPDTSVMGQSPQLASEIGRQAKAKMKDFRNHTVDGIEPPRPWAG